MPKKHYKTGGKTAKKNLDQFLTLDLDQFLTLETPNLGPVFNSTAYMWTILSTIKFKLDTHISHPFPRHFSYNRLSDTNSIGDKTITYLIFIPDELF